MKRARQPGKDLCADMRFHLGANWLLLQGQEVNIFRPIFFFFLNRQIQLHSKSSVFLFQLQLWGASVTASTHSLAWGIAVSCGGLGMRFSMNCSSSAHSHQPASSSCEMSSFCSLFKFRYLCLVELLTILDISISIDRWIGKT